MSDEPPLCDAPDVSLEHSDEAPTLLETGRGPSPQKSTEKSPTLRRAKGLHPSSRAAFVQVSTLINSNEQSDRLFVEDSEHREWVILCGRWSQRVSGRLAYAKLQAALLRCGTDERAKRNALTEMETMEATRLSHKIRASAKYLRESHRRLVRALPPVIVNRNTVVSKNPCIAAYYYTSLDAAKLSSNVEKMCKERDVADAQQKVLARMKERLAQLPCVPPRRKG